jgi:hypothetical protein
MRTRRGNKRFRFLNLFSAFDFRTMRRPSRQLNLADILSTASVSGPLF